MSIRLRQIELSHFMSIRYWPGMAIIVGSEVNVFIGPNNAGKSIVSKLFRFLYDWSHNQEIGAIGSSYWFMQDTSQPIHLWLVCRMHPPIKSLDLHEGNLSVFNEGWCWSTRLEIIPPVRADGLCEIEQLPVYWIGDEGHCFGRSSQRADGTSDKTFLQQDGTYKEGTCVGPELVHAQKETLKTLLETLVFFPTHAGHRAAQDCAAADLVARLKKLDESSTKSDNDKFEKILGDYNDLLVPTRVSAISRMRVKPYVSKAGKGRGGASSSQDTGDDFIEFKINGMPVSMDQAGEGLIQLLMLITELVVSDGAERIFFLDDPECHLHPSLVSRFMKYIRGFKNIQFLISTHSNVLLDCLEDNDTIHAFSQNRKGETTAQRCETQLIETLATLGIKISSLFQSNNVIWVEGPSDATYIRYWLSVASDARGLNIIEHSDYVFLNYGGDFTRHFARDHEDVEDLTELLKLCRSSAILINREIPDFASLSEMEPTKLLLLENFSKADGRRRLALMTNGRQIENDVPRKALLAALYYVFDDIEWGSLDELVFDSKKPLSVQIADKLWPNDAGKGEKFRATFDSDRTLLSHRAVQHWRYSGGLPVYGKLEYPEYIDELADFLVGGRAPDEAIPVADEDDETYS